MPQKNQKKIFLVEGVNEKLYFTLMAMANLGLIKCTLVHDKPMSLPTKYDAAQQVLVDGFNLHISPDIFQILRNALIAQQVTANPVPATPSSPLSNKDSN